MNYQHLMAIIKLRWQMTYNQWQKMGRVNAVLTVVFLCVVVLGVIGAFLFTLLAGHWFLGNLKPDHHLVMWMVLTGLFLFAWSVSILAELQRSELLSLENLLHLPVSLSGAFVLNYLSSWASFTILLFLPVLLAVSITLAVTQGAQMLWVAVLGVAFLVMVTGVTYQFRGWMGRIFQNKRKRGTVMAVVMLSFIALSQAPQLFNMWAMGDSESRQQRRTAQRELQAQQLKWKSEQFDAVLEGVRQTPDVAQVDINKLRKEFDAIHEQNFARERQVEKENTGQLVAAVNAGIPIGWLPYGVRAAAIGSAAVPALCTVGMLLIGGLSLSMAYRSTMRSYRFANDGSMRATASGLAKAVESSTPKRGLLDRDIPWVSDQTSAVALCSLQCLIRAPESKMALAMPLVLLMMYGSMALMSGTGEVPVMFRPFLPLGAIAVSMFGMAQLTINMFGMDRAGFKAYVMMPVVRWRVLLGKNLSLMPPVIAMMLILILLIQFCVPMQVMHLLASIMLIVPSTLVYLLLGNYVSIRVPVAMPYGSTKPMKSKFATVILQMLYIMLTPLLVVPAAIAYSLELGLIYWLELSWLSLYLLFAVAETIGGILIYSTVLKTQGEFLQKREQNILAIVTSQSE